MKFTKSIPQSNNLNKIRTEIARERKSYINIVIKPVDLETKDFLTLSTIGDRSQDSFKTRLSFLNQHQINKPPGYIVGRKKLSMDFSNLLSSRDESKLTSKLNNLKYSLMTRGLQDEPESSIFSSKGKIFLRKAQKRLKSQI
jgi:hypothetical protein